MLLEILDSPVELFASTVLKHFHQARVDVFPNALLLSRVIKRRNRITNSVVKSNLGDLLTTFSVLGVLEARMVSFLNTITFRKNSLSQVVQVRNLSWEPWYFSWTNRSDVVANLAQVNHSLAHIMLLEWTFEVDEEFHMTFIPTNHLRRPRLDPCHINVVLGKYLKCLV